MDTKVTVDNFNPSGNRMLILDIVDKDSSVIEVVHSNKNHRKQSLCRGKVIKISESATNLTSASGDVKPGDVVIYDLRSDLYNFSDEDGNIYRLIRCIDVYAVIEEDN